jgi:hypothetical protein
VLAATGANFQNAKMPIPMLQVGNPGQTGIFLQFLYFYFLPSKIKLILRCGAICGLHPEHQGTRSGREAPCLELA